MIDYTHADNIIEAAKDVVRAYRDCQMKNDWTPTPMIDDEDGRPHPSAVNCQDQLEYAVLDLEELLRVEP